MKKLIVFIIIFLLKSIKTEETIPKDDHSTHLDIVFVIDSTGSMSPYIAQTKKIIRSTMSLYLQRNQNVLFGVVTYRDFPPQDNTFVTKFQDFATAEKTYEFLDNLNTDGGGDFPEAVLSGINDAIAKLTWRNLKSDNEIKYKKDAPPHGIEYSDVSRFNKNEYISWANGEPSGYTIDYISDLLNEGNFYYYFCKISEYTDKMERIFERKINKYKLIDNMPKEENINSYQKEFEKYRKSSGESLEDLEKLYDNFYENQEEIKNYLYEAQTFNSMEEL